MQKTILSVSAIILITTLSACSPFKPSDHRAAVCNELNSELIFNGGTSNMRNAEIQSSADPLIQRQYDKSNCEH